ncbi:MAG: hypothetical protein AAB019_07505, partial [Planctomycetota bacterium]
AVTIGFAIGFFRRISFLAAAAYLDKMAGAKELISTAYEYGLKDPTDVATNWNLQRAEATLRSLNLSSLVSYRIPYRKWYHPMLLLIFIIFYFIPPVSSSGRKNKPAKILPHQLSQLANMAHQIKTLSDSKKPNPIQTLPRDIQLLTEAIKQGALEKKDALVATNKLAEKTDSLKKELQTKQQTLETLKKSNLTKDLAESLSQNDLKSMEKEIKELQDKLLKNKFDQRELETLEKRLQELSEQLSEQSDLKETMKNLSDALAGKNFKELPEKLQKLLDELGELSDWSAEELAQMEKSLEELLEELEEIDAELAEIDPNGQESCPTCGKKLAVKGKGKGKGNQCGTCQDKKFGLVKGKGGPLAGGGTTNEGPEKGPKAHQGRSHDEGGTNTKPLTDWEKIYAPVKLETERTTDILSKRKITGQGQVLTTRFKGVPDKKNEALMPIREALPVYKEAAEKAMNESAIPLEYKETVRQYFESLDKK